MPFTHLPTILAVLLIGAILGFAACGDDDDDDVGEPTPTSEEEMEDDDEHEEEAHWGYEGDVGPVEWASLSEEFYLCEEGVGQSPVDIDTANAVPANIPDPVFHWPAQDLEVVNNGHTIQANVPEGATTELNGKAYDLIQFHWHRPSEHTVDGTPFEMELHFVHANAASELAVLGVLLEAGDGNPLYDVLWEAQPEEGGSTMLTDIDYSRLLPGDVTTYVYSGSLTTPPCSEGVAWNVLEAPADLSQEQIENFLYEGNARPVQPLNDRELQVDE